MNKNVRIAILAAIILTLGLSILLTISSSSGTSLDLKATVKPVEDTRPKIEIRGIQIPVTLATSTDDVKKGLSGRTSLAMEEGMLFMFPAPYRYRFWMPDMQFPLDIIWIDGEKKIIEITKNAPPLPDKTKPVFYQPHKPAQYVLEVNAGFSDQHLLAPGDQVIFIKI